MKHIIIIISFFLSIFTIISCGENKEEHSDETVSNTNETVSNTKTGTYIAVGKSGTIITSSNRTFWNSNTSGTSNFLMDIKYGNNTFITVGIPGPFSPHQM